MTDPSPTPATPFGWRLAQRPDVRFGHAAGGVGGILVAAATLAFVAALTGENATVPGVGLTLLLVAVALLAGWRVRGPVRSAAVAAIAVAVPLLWLFAVAGDGEAPGRGGFRLVLVLSVASYAALYLVTWTRGRAVLLGLALLLGATWVVFEVARQDAPLAVTAVGEARSGSDDPTALLTSGDRSGEVAGANLVIAVVLLGGGIGLDRRGRAGVATPFLLVGGLYAVNAAITLGAEADDVTVTGVLLVLAGLAIGLAGSLGRRRGTSWIGALVVLGGALVVIAQVTADSANGGGDALAWRFGVFALLGAAVLLVTGVVVARRLGEPIDGGEPALAGPPPETGSPPSALRWSPEPRPEA